MSLSRLTFIFTLIFAVNIIFTALTPCAWGEKGELFIKRTLSMEWESVSETIGYELEVTRVLKNGTRRKPLFFKTKLSLWKGVVNAGRYEVRLRSSDDRGVYGDWSPPIEVWARLPNPEIQNPIADTEIKSTEDETDIITLKWSNVAGASGYWIEIKNEAGELIHEGVVPQNQLEYKFKVAQKYSWRVATIMPEEDKPPLEDVRTNLFSVIGTQLSPPQLIRPESKFVTEVEWTKPARSEYFSFELYRRTPKNWVRLETKDNIESNKIVLNPNYPGGIMRIKVIAHGKMRGSSNLSIMDFSVYEGSRTPAAIEEAKLRESIEREHDHLFIGSYLFSSISYLSRNRQAGRSSRFESIAGTGRLGYGYLPNKSNWGFLTIADLSGTLIQNKNHLFYSAEAQAVWHTYLRSVTQLRLYGGGYVRQLPEAVQMADTSVKIQDVSAMGPHFGLQLWHPITYKLGVQANAQALFSMLTLKTPNGNDISPSLSYQMGLLGSYKIRENMTGLIGYAYRLDTIKYKATPYDGTDLNNFAKAGDINEVSIEGHYLNLFFEWGF